MIRPNGYYWVYHTERWEIAEWFIDHWECIGIDRSYQDCDFKKIGRMIAAYSYDDMQSSNLSET